MRIIAVQDADWCKKGPHQQHHLLERLSAKGHEIIVIGFDQLWRESRGNLYSRRKVQDNVARFYPGAHIRYIRPGFLRVPFLDYVSFTVTCRRELTQLATFRPDCVVGFTSVISCYLGMRFAQKQRIPFIYYWTDVVHALVPGRPLQAIAKLIEMSTIMNSSGLVAINGNLGKRMDDLGGEGSRISIITGGVDPERFNPSKVSGIRMRERFGIQKDDLVLFYMGWIYGFSGLQDVVSSLREVEGPPKLKLLIVGDGENFADLKEHVKRTGLSERVIMTGRMPYDDIPSLVAAADVCIMPSRENDIMRDIVPIKMYEYLAMHKPVVSTRLPGIVEEFGCHNGVVFVHGASDIVPTVLRMSPQDRQQISREAERFVKGRNWSKISNDFEKLIIECIQDMSA
jgi:glycosyltransferase involved in cell wall biosynthesis